MNTPTIPVQYSPLPLEPSPHANSDTTPEPAVHNPSHFNNNLVVPDAAEFDRKLNLSHVVSSLQQCWTRRLHHRQNALLYDPIQLTTVRISRIPRDVTYDQILQLLTPFGPIHQLIWTASDPYMCDVRYQTLVAASDACQTLNHTPFEGHTTRLKAALISTHPRAQLHVGNITPGTSEERVQAAIAQVINADVVVVLKRHLTTYATLSYGLASFADETAANMALLHMSRIKVTGVPIHLATIQHSASLYVNHLSSTAHVQHVYDLFSTFGELDSSESAILSRAYAIVRYKNRASAEKAKRTLDRPSPKSSLSVRYAEAEQLKETVAVQFHTSLPRAPNSLVQLVHDAFDKFGECTVDVPTLNHDMWRKIAFVRYVGEPVAAHVAAQNAVQNVQQVVSLPVCCQFARELIPRFGGRGVSVISLMTSQLEAGEKRQTALATHVQQPFKKCVEDENELVPVYVPVAALGDAGVSPVSG